MSIRYLSFFSFLILTLLTNFSSAENKDSVFVFSDSTKIKRINGINHFRIFEDQSNTLDFATVVKKHFDPCTQEIPNLGVTPYSYWIKLQIKNMTSVNDLLLELAQSTIDEIEFYSMDSTGKVEFQESGEQVPFFDKKYKHPNYVFDLNLVKGQTKIYYFKVRSGEQIMVPVAMGRSQLIYEAMAHKDTIFGVYFGIILVMVLYNFFIYVTVRDHTYLWYVTYIMMVGLTQLSLHGYTYKYFWPKYPAFANESVFLLTSLTSIVAIPFIRNFLQTKKYVPKLNKALDIFSIVFVICIVLSLLNFYNLSFQLMQVDTMLLSLYLLFIGFKIYWAGYRTARFFLVAWSIFLVGVFIFILKDFGILPNNNFTFYMMPAGSAIETILLSFALADRIKILQKEKMESQVQALEALRENERIIKEQNVLLESKVAERTSALEQSNEELTTALSELKQTQSQLVNAEKMASLGQLTAGIAHEINNPINFVVSNVKPLQRDIEDIQELVSKYEIISNNGDKEADFAEIESFRKEIDYEYLKVEIRNLLKGIEEGATRTADIVKGLRVFSRLDENDLKRTNITEGINSTLTLLNTEILGSIDLVKNFAQLPEIECYPGKLNQVFMNIMNNAIFAIKANDNRKEKGRLEITTSYDHHYVYIFIKDNGTGMTEEVKAKVFEPFFTTKDVGKGTGLGMSITFSIIEDHKGTIEVNTEPGKGSEFIIKLPVNNR